MCVTTPLPTKDRFCSVFLERTKATILYNSKALNAATGNLNLYIKKKDKKKRNMKLHDPLDLKSIKRGRYCILHFKTHSEILIGMILNFSMSPQNNSEKYYSTENSRGFNRAKHKTQNPGPLCLKTAEG